MLCSFVAVYAKFKDVLMGSPRPNTFAGNEIWYTISQCSISLSLLALELIKKALSLPRMIMNSAIFLLTCRTNLRPDMQTIPVKDGTQSSLRVLVQDVTGKSENDTALPLITFRLMRKKGKQNKRERDLL